MTKDEAQRELDDTIRRLAPVLDLIEPDEVIAAWALVGHSVGPVEDDMSHYFHAYSGGSMPNHAAIGLFRMAQLRSEAEDDA